MNQIYLKKSNCRHCYACIKACPVKSIKIDDGQAVILESDCILCGRCLAACPQNAKAIVSELDKVKDLIAAGQPVIASLAPSYGGSFAVGESGRLAAALKKLGFWGVAETAEGAVFVTEAYRDLINRGGRDVILSSCCPAVNDYIEKYFPDLTSYLAPVESPMIAHGKILKAKYGPQAKIVFIGPCLAKKEEAVDIRHDGQIDAVLTFDDLDQWFKDEKIRPDDRPPESFLNEHPQILQLYPLTGGILAALQALKPDGSWGYLGVDGLEACRDLFESLRKKELHHCFIEINACEGGCLNGPAKVHDGPCRFAADQEIRRSVQEKPGYPVLPDHPDLRKVFLDRRIHNTQPDEQTIRDLLRKIGKETPDQELNCGSCGYPTCRAKVTAVYQGKAELSMCMPYMKQRAESLANYVLSESPDAAIIIDSEQNIVEFNAAAEKLFGCRRGQVLGKGLYELINAVDFQSVLDDHQSIYDKKITYEELGITTLQSIIYLSEVKMVMGLFKDITSNQRQRDRTYKLKVEAVEMAQNVINKQMVAAQQIASLLGETTAETKVTLTRLKEILIDGDE